MTVKVLVVDDEQDILGLLEIKLRRAGLEVFTAHDGEEGLRNARAEVPDVVLLDVMMPRMDGYTAAQRIKSEVRPVPIVLMLTARSVEADLIALRSRLCYNVPPRAKSLGAWEAVP